MAATKDYSSQQLQLNWAAASWVSLSVALQYKEQNSFNHCLSSLPATRLTILWWEYTEDDGVGKGDQLQMKERHRKWSVPALALNIDPTSVAFVYTWPDFGKMSKPLIGKKHTHTHTKE